MRGTKSKGAALISVLLIFAIITILATQLITRSQADIERTRWLITEAQAYQYALGGEALARQILWQQHQDLKSKGGTASPIPQLLPVYQPDNGQMAIEIVDLQGRINLNNISGQQIQRRAIENLFKGVLLKPRLTTLLADWADSDTTPQAGGAEDFHYLSLEMPYRAGNKPLADRSELQLLPDITHEEYLNVEEYLTALKAPTTININTAPAELFQFLDPQLSGAQVINTREQKSDGFLSVEEFLAADITAGLSIDPSLLTVTSSNYGVKIMATVNDRRLWLFSQFSLDNTNGEIRLLRRTTGEKFIVNLREISDADQDDKTTNPLL